MPVEGDRRFIGEIELQHFNTSTLTFRRMIFKVYQFFEDATECRIIFCGDLTEAGYTANVCQISPSLTHLGFSDTQNILIHQAYAQNESIEPLIGESSYSSMNENPIDLKLLSIVGSVA